MAQESQFKDTIVIKNYSSSNYQASPVNYGGVTLKNNIILIANDRGVLQYNGSGWELITISNDSRATSIMTSDSLIYVGGDDEFGYLEKNREGKFQYFSLRKHLEDSVKLNGIFQLVQINNNVYFQSYENILRWDGVSVHKIKLTNAHIFKVGEKLLASQYDGGLYLIDKDSAISINKKFTFKEDAVFDVFPINNDDEFIICTSENGLYIFDNSNNSTQFWDSEASHLLKKDGYYKGIVWLDSLFAATTWDGGVLIFNKKGKVKKLIDKSDGISGKYLRELFVDNRNKLWIASDVGISELYWSDFDTLTQVSLTIHKVSLNGENLTPTSLVDSLLRENSDIKIFYCAPGFGSEEVLYSYRLDGIDNDWSVWGAGSSKEYTGLKGGEYNFLIKAKTVNGLESNVASIKFKTLTPWFKTIWAYTLYAFAILGLIALLIRLRTLRLQSINRWLESTVSARTDEINAKKEELTLANENLDVKNQELDHFVYRSSHDLIAPLKSLKGLINIAKSDNPQENQLEYLKHMESSVLKLEDFINSIIDFTTNAKTQAQRIEIDINEILNDISQELKYFEKAEQVTLIRTLTLPTVKSDPKRLKIILSNLISNGVKYHNYNQENPFIEVNTYQDENKSYIEVIDNGEGIKAELVDNIFDMFFRASDTSEGSGLGLYIVRDTVARISGELKVDSTYGQGSTFTLILDN
jgi:signal transduction histidine kinase